jgi:hypothetical protein
MSQAMKVENMLKIKEEFDYKSLSRKLEIQLDKLIAENERQQKAFEDDIEKINLEAQCRIIEAERKFANELEVCGIIYMKQALQLSIDCMFSFLFVSFLNWSLLVLKYFTDVMHNAMFGLGGFGM